MAASAGPSGSVGQEGSGRLPPLLPCSNCTTVKKDATTRNLAPYLLPCLHAICETCIAEIKAKACCPVCKVQFSKEALKKNILSVPDAVLKLPPRCQASACLDGAPLAVVRCDICKESLCEGCKQAHLRVTATRTHTLQMLASSGHCANFPTCKEHQHMPLVLYCAKPCTVPICFQCQQQSHSNHSVCKIEDSLRHNSQMLRNVMNQTQEGMQQMKATRVMISQRLSEVDKQEQDLTMVLKKAILQLQDCVTRRGKILLDGLKKAAEAKRNSYIEMQCETTRTFMLYDQCKMFGEATLKTENPFTLLGARQPIVEQQRIVSNLRKYKEKQFNGLQVAPSIGLTGLNTSELEGKLNNYGQILVDKAVFPLHAQVPVASPPLGAAALRGPTPPGSSHIPQTSLGPGAGAVSRPSTPSGSGSTRPPTGAMVSYTALNQQLAMPAGQTNMNRIVPNILGRNPNTAVSQALSSHSHAHRAQQQPVLHRGPSPMSSGNLSPAQQQMQGHARQSQGVAFVSSASGHPAMVSSTTRPQIASNNANYPNVATHLSQPSLMNSQNTIRLPPGVQISPGFQHQLALNQHNARPRQMVGPPPLQRYPTNMQQQRPPVNPPPIVAQHPTRPNNPMSQLRSLVHSPPRPIGPCGPPNTVAPSAGLLNNSASSNNAPPPSSSHSVSLDEILGNIDEVVGGNTASANEAARSSATSSADGHFSSVKSDDGFTTPERPAFIKASPSYSLNSPSFMVDEHAEATSEIDAIVKAKHAEDVQEQTRNKPPSPNQVMTRNNGRRSNGKDLNAIVDSLLSGRPGQQSHETDANTSLNAVSSSSSAKTPSPILSHAFLAPPPASTSVPPPSMDVTRDAHERSQSADETKYNRGEDKDIQVVGVSLATRTADRIPRMVLERKGDGNYNPVICLGTPSRHDTDTDDPRRETPDASQVSSTGGKNNDEWEDYCAVCQNGCDPDEVLLCCSGCPKVYHIYCHVPNVLSVPKDEWFCTFCIKPEKEVVTQEASMQKKRKAGELTNYERSMCEKLLLHLFVAQLSVPFREPVDRKFREYYEVINHPMDLNTIRKRIDPSYHGPKIRTVQRFLKELNQVFRNASRFNQPQSEMADAARAVHAIYESCVAKLFQSEYKKYVWRYTVLNCEPPSEDDDDEDVPGPSNKRRKEAEFTNDLPAQ